jgi:alpha-N-arabinofuranosidase
VVNEGRPIALEMRVPGLPAHPFPAPAVREDFDAPLGPAWNFLRNPERASYSTTERRGWLTLHGTAVPLDQPEGASPTYVGRRQEALRARVATRIDFTPARAGEEAGLVLYREPHHRFELGVRRAGRGREVFVRQTVGAYVSTVTAAAGVPGNTPLVLQIEAEPTRYTFSWGTSPERSGAGTLQPLGNAETRLLSTEVAGGFIGTYVGMYARAPGDAARPAAAAFDWFDFEKHE